MGLAVDPEEFAEVTIYFSGNCATRFSIVRYNISLDCRHCWLHDNRRSLYARAGRRSSQRPVHMFRRYNHELQQCL